MLKVTLTTLMLVPTAMLLPYKYLFPTTVAYSMMITLHTLTWFYHPMNHTYSMLNVLFGLDPISVPLTILSTWLLPLMILASQNYLYHEPEPRQRIFIMTCVGLQTTLILTFAATTLTMFYIMFEATLLPTLIIITRWGSQAERLIAGTYFLFYTLAGSLPFLVALLTLHTNLCHTTILLLTLGAPQMSLTGSNILMWFAMLIALMIKMPLYGFHLWLPKAHVEAPVAGSMVLAAILLKLGGYGLIRITPTLTTISQTMYYLPVIMALWGMVMTSLICLRQVDLKAIIAYSSVSHMGLIITATMIQTPWSIPGAMVLMIAHGLTSSLLFCLANMHYERTHTRTLILTRGCCAALPLTTAWWFLSSLLNLALPPTTNLLGELMIITALFNWATTTIIFTGLTTLLTAIYTLYMFITTQQGKPLMQNAVPPPHSREHLLAVLHLAPLLLLSLHPNTML